MFDTSAAGAEDKLLEVALDAGADDVQSEDGESTVLCAAEDFEAVKARAARAGCRFVPLRGGSATLAERTAAWTAAARSGS